MELVTEDEEEKQIRIDTIKKCIESLSPRCKEIFNLSKFSDLKYQEIADTLNISINTVEVQMTKAFLLIKKGSKIIDLFFFNFC